jgi:hypothetical protein
MAISQFRNCFVSIELLKQTRFDAVLSLKTTLNLFTEIVEIGGSASTLTPLDV